MRAARGRRFSRSHVRSKRSTTSTIKRYVKRRREGEDFDPKPSTGRKRRILATSEKKQALWKRTTRRLSSTTAVVGRAKERESIFRHDEPSDPPEAGPDAQKGRWVPTSDTNKREVLGEAA